MAWWWRAPAGLKVSFNWTMFKQKVRPHSNYQCRRDKYIFICSQITKKPVRSRMFPPSLCASRCLTLCIYQNKQAAVHLGSSPAATASSLSQHAWTKNKDTVVSAPVGLKSLVLIKFLTRQRCRCCVDHGCGELRHQPVCSQRRLTIYITKFSHHLVTKNVGSGVVHLEKKCHENAVWDEFSLEHFNILCC